MLGQDSTINILQGKKNRMENKGFISRVKQRLEYLQDYDHFKRLWPSYELMDKLGIVRPKIYITVPKAEVNDIEWQTLSPRLPNLFVVRPTLFVNPSHDFMIRDDGPRGLMNFNTRSIHPPKEILKQQVQFVQNMPEEDMALVFEEFPLTYTNTLSFPAHYRVHVFGDNVGCIQCTTKQVTFWMDEECKIIHVDDNQDVSNLIPSVGVVDDICESSKKIAFSTGLPYVRIDFVASTKGIMFRSFACVPGDVRSDDHNKFYKKNDEYFGELWERAELRVSTPKSKQNSEEKEKEKDDNRRKARSRPATMPDDNA